MKDLSDFNFSIEKIENDSGSEETEELLHDYWCFTDSTLENFENFENDKLKFKYPVSYLIEKYDIKRNHIPAVVRSNGFLQLKTTLACNNCQGLVAFETRNELTTKFRGNTPGRLGFCATCYTKHIDAKLEKVLNKINKISDKDKIAETNEKNDQLSYIEKVLLVIILTSKEINKDRIDENDWSNFIAIEVNQSKSLINKLIKKGYFTSTIQFEHVNDIIHEFRSINVSEHLEYATDEIVSKIKLAFESLSAPCFVLPAGFQDHEEFASHLFDDLQRNEVHLSDIRDIENYIINKRMHEIECIFLSVCRDSNIPHKIDNSLLLIFKRMSEKYTLKECNNIINYRAKDVVFNINKAKINRTNTLSIPYFFRNNLERYMDYIDNLDNPTIYTRRLGHDWMRSEIEAFVSLHLIRSSKSWDDLTADEIIESWVSKLEVIN